MGLREMGSRGTYVRAWGRNGREKGKGERERERQEGVVPEVIRYLPS